MLAFITSRFGAMIGAGVGIALAVFLGFKLLQANGTIHELRKDLRTASAALREASTALIISTGELKRSEAAIMGLRGSIDTQNAAVTAWQARAQAAEREKAKVAKEVTSLRQRAQRTMAAKPQGDDMCKAASQLYLDYAEGGR